MVSLDSLPTELIALIFDHATKGSLARLCRTTKRFHLLAEERLYSSFPGDSQCSTKLREFVLALLDRPKSTALVTSLDFVQDQEDQNSRPHSQPIGYLRHSEHFHEGGENSPFDLAIEFSGLLDQSITDGDPRFFTGETLFRPGFAQLYRSQSDDRLPLGVHANLLLSMVHNVVRLRLDSDWVPACDFQGVNAKSIGRHALDWKAILQAKGSALRRVTEIEVVARKSMIAREVYFDQSEQAASDAVVNVDWDQADPRDLALLPALQILRFTGNFEIKCFYPPVPGSFSVTTLILERCALGCVKQIARLVEACKALKTFKCHVTTEHGTYYHAVPYAYAVLDALLQHRSTLEKLSIGLDDDTEKCDAPNVSDDALGFDHFRSPQSLQQFSALKELQLDYAMFRYDGVTLIEDSCKDQELPLRISDSLPKDIERLAITKLPLLDAMALSSDSINGEERYDISGLRKCSARTWLSALACDIPSYHEQLHTVELNLWDKEDLERDDGMRYLFREQAGCNIVVG